MCESDPSYIQAQGLAQVQALLAANGGLNSALDSADYSFGPSTPFDPTASQLLSAAASQMFKNDVTTLASPGTLSSDVTALAGAYDLLRATTDLAAPSAAAGDEVIGSILGGNNELPNYLSSPNSIDTELNALAAAPGTAPSLQSWISKSEQAAGVLASQVALYLHNGEPASTGQVDVQVASTLAQLSAGNALVNQRSWSFSTDTLSFPSTSVGSSSTLSVTLTNTSIGRSIALSPPEITGGGAGAFTVAHDGCLTLLAPEASCAVTLAFKPPSKSSFVASLSLGTTGGGGPQNVSLVGAGK
jgi:hypothetical protein